MQFHHQKHTYLGKIHQGRMQHIVLTLHSVVYNCDNKIVPKP